MFLDANVLFSAAYRKDSKFRQLWSNRNVKLLTSTYAAEEARRNLDRPEQLQDLEVLLGSMSVVEATAGDFETSVDLHEKDIPILMGAVAAKATHLLTGDFTHFGRYFGKTLEGIRISSPGDYLREATVRKKKK